MSITAAENLDVGTAGLRLPEKRGDVSGTTNPDLSSRILGGRSGLSSNTVVNQGSLEMIDDMERLRCSITSFSSSSVSSSNLESRSCEAPLRDRMLGDAGKRLLE